MIEALKNTVDKVRFIIRHSTTPELASRARDVMLENQRLLDGMLERGMVTEERLTDIEEDSELQDYYFSVLKRARDGGKAAKEALFELFFLPPDELGGWFEYYRKSYEKRWNLKLISPED